MRPEIAVIGGGIIGCSVVRALLDADVPATITLIERDLIGLGASQRSAGFHFPKGRGPHARAMTAYSERIYKALLADDPAMPIWPCEVVAITHTPAEDSLRQHFLDPGPIETSRPHVRLALSWPEEAVHWAVPGCHYADVGDLARRLARGFRRSVDILEGTAVVAVSERADGVTLTLGTGRELIADRVVLAPGPWATAPAWAGLTRSLGIRVKRIVAFHLDLPINEQDPALLFPEEDAFLLPLRHLGHWLYSYTCDDWDVEPDSDVLGLDSRHVEAAQAVLRRYAPDLADDLRAGRVFCDAYSPLREPAIAVAGKTGRILFAGAANGSGYRLAPAIASAVVNVLSHRTTPEMEGISCA